MDKQLLEQEAEKWADKFKTGAWFARLRKEAYIAGATSSSTVKNLEREVKRLKGLLVFWWKVANRISESDARKMLGAKEFIDWQKQIEDRINNFKEQNNL